jgi:hypothetical protein
VNEQNSTSEHSDTSTDMDNGIANASERANEVRSALARREYVVRQSEQYEIYECNE